MTKKGSARVSKQEEDLVQRSTKKVKTRASVDLNQPSEDMEVTGPCDGNKSGASKISYKDTLLTVAGSIIEDEHVDMEEVNEDIPDPENRWYQDADKDTHEEEPFNPCPTIPISKEEFDEWCKPWRSALYVKLLGKRVGLGFMEQRLKRDWGLHQICFSCGKYGHRSDLCTDEPVGKTAGHEASAEGNTMVFEDPPSVETENQNGKNQDPSGGNQGNQISPDFGPWMLVKRNFRRKKGMNNQGKIGGMIGQDLPNNQEREYEDDMPTNANGSRFITLNEEGINSSAKNSMQEEAIIASSGPEASKALIVNNKSQIIQKKSYGLVQVKIHSGKMGPFNKVGPQGSEKGLKPNPKIVIKNPSSSPEASKSIVTVSPTKKSRETNDMEGVVMEYMRKLQREQNEAFVAMKQVATGHEGSVVRNNSLLMNASSSDSHMDIEAVRSPGKDLDRPPDEKPQISRSRGVWIRNNIGFGSSFIVEANGRSGGIWCLWDSGDFNATLHDYERRGGSTNVVHSACPDFQSCISDCRLIDLSFVGWPFTWRRGNWDVGKLETWLAEDVIKKIVAIAPLHLGNKVIILLGTFPQMEPST
ncbi:hypothetical protein Ahy_B05g078586 [Arachis hypogaea]|uniref:CCHC-type domain-containing protein n=1 Tax=Arachis hypogaea TaxID=3818 RepID=A0A444Z7K4_ARAHY|nr:hypothetical protein Ahy_B05g078586 [Arachis hypogaea]